ncbi:MAG TPA: autotransporter domain-containing protein [Bauldia sp.]|nr:autotransporter domain-containing protein [Bauldia sp.]
MFPGIANNRLAGEIGVPASARLVLVGVAPVALGELGELMRRNWIEKTAARLARPAVRKVSRITLRPRSSKSWLMGGTALFGGVLSVSVLWSTDQALAAVCGPADGTAFICSGSGGAFIFEPTGEPWTGELVGTVPGTAANLTGTLTINNGNAPTAGGDYNGTVNMHAGAVIDAASGNGIDLYNDVPVDSLVTFNIDGTIETEGSPSDGMYLGGYRVDVLISESGSVMGEDHGINAFGSTSLHVQNANEVIGLHSAAIAANVSGGYVWLENGSSQSVMGTIGLSASASQVVVDNHMDEAGLIAGLTGDGIQLNNISGSGLGVDLTPLHNNDLAVDIDNTRGAVIAGYSNGIYINNVFGDKSGPPGEGDAADVVIDNYGKLIDPTWVPGGLIAGVNGDGVHIQNVRSEGGFGNGGSVTIRNDFTQQSGIELTSLDTQVYNVIPGDGLLNGVLPGFAGPSGPLTTGIFGFQDGVDVSNVDDFVYVSNQAGQIVGKDNVGVRISNVGDPGPGGVLIDNSGPFVANLYGESGGYLPGGTIWGGEDGINVSNVWGEAPESSETGFLYYGLSPSIVVNNILGLTTGQHNGAVFSESWELEYFNFGGTTVGSWDEGIRTNSVQKVGIFNGAGWIGDKYSQGDIIGGDTAIHVVDSEDALVLNLDGGNIVGDGKPYQPVMSFSTWFNGEDGVQALVINSGLMTSKRNPYFERDWSPLAVNEPVDFFIDTAQIANDAFNFAAFAGSGGSLGYINGIQDYAHTSSDLLMYSEGGAAALVNLPNLFGWGSESEGEANGIMFGRVKMFGSSEDCFEGCDVGNTVVNASQWFVTNRIYFDKTSEGDVQDGNPWRPGTGDPFTGGTVLVSPFGENAIYNFGAVHTGFGDSEHGGTYTSFILDNFYNGGPVEGFDAGSMSTFLSESPSSFLDIFGKPYENGLLSMVDGFAGTSSEDFENPFGAKWPGVSSLDSYIGDVTQIFGTFYGSEDNGLYRSYLAIDAYLDKPISQGGSAASDLFVVSQSESEWLYGWDGAMVGSTGVILNAMGPSGYNQSGILFAHADWILTEDACTGPNGYCVDGNVLYLAANQPGYINVDGVGAVQKGLYAWYIKEQDTGESDGSYIDPDFYLVSDYAPAVDQAPSVTTGAVNIASSLFDIVWEHVRGYHFPVSGGGGGADLAMAPDANKKGIWLRASGSWANQDTHVTQGPLDIDTGFNQNIYSLLGGGDFSPNGDGPGMRYGVFGGYVSSRLNFDSYSANVAYSGGIVGGYASYDNAAGFYADAQLSDDFLKATFTMPSLTAKVDVNSIGLMANVGKRFDRGRFFVEPVGSFAWVHTSVSDFASGGTTVDYSNGESVRVGLGARVGTNMKMKSGMSAELSLLGKVWDELSGDNTVTVSDGINTATFTDRTGGIFGEVAASATIYNDARTMSGFVSGGAQFGSDGTIWNAKVGARRAF